MSAPSRFDIEISLFESFFKEAKIITIIDTLHCIKSDKYKDWITQLRKHVISNPDEYSQKKRLLPGITFSAKFYKDRKLKDLEHYTNALIVDIDKLDSDELLQKKKSISNDNIVFGCWISPSGLGLKVLFFLEYEFNIAEIGIDKSHKIAFSLLDDYFKINYGIQIDKSGSDISRLCFFSWDPEIYINEDARSFRVVLPKDIKKDFKPQHIRIPVAKQPRLEIEESLTRDMLFNPLGRNNFQNKSEIKKIITFLQKNNLSITYSYIDWLLVGFAIAESFTFEIGLKYFLNLSAQDKDKFNQSEATRMLENCYQYSQHKTHFKQIVELAVLQGYKTKNSRVQDTYTAEFRS